MYDFTISVQHKHLSIGQIKSDHELPGCFVKELSNIRENIENNILYGCTKDKYDTHAIQTISKVKSWQA
jgi:hypothetical protein